MVGEAIMDKTKNKEEEKEALLEGKKLGEGEE